MDWIDIVIVFCIVFFLFTRRIARKAKSLAPPIEVQHENVFENVEQKQDDFSAEMQDFSVNSPKNEEVFTYETLEPELSTPFSTEPELSNSTVEKNVQIVENEEVKNIDIQFNINNIVNGIIYSEILKKPYN